MRRPNLSKWENVEELKGLLFFAQAIAEQLFFHTIDSYKASALNLNSSLFELRTFASQFEKGIIYSKAMDHVVEEFKYRLKNDIIVRNKKPFLYPTYSKLLTDSGKNPKALLEVIDTLSLELSGFYWSELKEMIREVVRNPKHKKDTLYLVNSFISEAEIRGYTRHYISNKAWQYFFNANYQPPKINSLDQISNFLDLFGGKKHNFKVIIEGSKIFEKLPQDLLAENFDLKIRDVFPDDIRLTQRVKEFSKNCNRNSVFLIIEDIEAPEPFAARNIAQHLLEVINSLFSVHYHGFRPKWNKRCIVVDADTEDTSVLNPPISLMKLGTKRPHEVNQKDVVSTLDVLKGRHFVDSYIFLKVFDYHRASIEATTSENKLIDLWAALEGFSTPPSQGKNRRDHYLGLLLPSLTLTYPEKIFRYIKRSINFAGDSCRTLVNSVPLSGDFFDKTVCLLVSKDMEQKRDEFYSQLDKHPLLRFRCYAISEQFRSTRKIERTLKIHRLWVSWHIKRIYATRNQIVHYAESLPYLDTLVENLHSYLDILTSAVIKVGLQSEIRTSIPDVLYLLRIHEREYLNFFTGDEHDCDSANFKELIFGAHNPLSPYYN